MGGAEAFDEWVEAIADTSIPRRCSDLVWRVSGIETD
jgi:hypothetical protein